MLSDETRDFLDRIEYLMAKSTMPGFLFMEVSDIAVRFGEPVSAIRQRLGCLHRYGHIRRGGTHGEWFYYSPRVVSGMVKGALCSKGLFVHAVNATQ